MKNLLTEFIGTFFLVLTIGLTAAAGSPTAPLAVGSVLIALVYMGGHLSGAHYNPAISLALLMRGEMEARDFVPYLLAQVTGAGSAAWVVHLLVGQTFAPAPGDGISDGAALLAEALFTFALALVVLNVAASPKTAGNSYYGLAIGLTVMAGAFAVGPISGAAFNPAVGLGPTVVQALAGGGSFGDLWLYLVGPFAGGALATVAFRFQSMEA